jgi:transcriptional regulator, LysR family
MIYLELIIRLHRTKKGATFMEMRQLRYFLDIAQTEHLTQSAQNLFVTQSTLSHGLRQLEQELEIQLFDRLGRGLRLSQAGAAFRVHAARALQEIEAGRMALADMTGLQSGALTVGVIPPFCTPWCRPRWRRSAWLIPGSTLWCATCAPGPSRSSW